MSTEKTITVYEHHCRKCGFLWQTKLRSPRVCLRCKRYDWREERVRGHIDEKEAP